MSELKELTYDIITNAFIKALADIDKGTGIRDKHFVAATELIIKNFKAHIEECDWPENPTPDLHRGMDTYLGGLHAGWKRAIEEDRKALMESLE